MNKIKKGDIVKVIAGDSKGIQGEVLRVSGEKVLVKGVNIITKAQKPTNQYPDGGIVKHEAPINISNVVLVEEKTGAKIKVGFKVVDKKKVRINKKTGQEI